jgi:hypothetical protein
MRRINSARPGRVEKKQSFWERLFLPSNLIPSAALAVTVVVLFFILNIGNDIEDPLLMEPKLREDVINPDNMLVIYLPLNFNKGKQSSEKGYSNIGKFKDEKTYAPQESDDNLYFPDDYYLINKKGLNFRQVNLTKEEQQKLSELKEHFEMLLKNRANN